MGFAFLAFFVLPYVEGLSCFLPRTSAMRIRFASDFNVQYFRGEGRVREREREVYSRGAHLQDVTFRLSRL